MVWFGNYIQQFYPGVISFPRPEFCAAAANLRNRKCIKETPVGKYPI